MRIAVFFAMFLVVGCATRPSKRPVQYFPDLSTTYQVPKEWWEILGPETSVAIRERWYAACLVVMEEPSLWELRESGREMYRFLWLRSFHAPVAFRLEVRADGSGTLTVRKNDHYDSKRLRDQTLPISKAQVAGFVACLEGAHFWDLSWSESPWLTGNDGSQWVYEGIKDKKYHLTDRWSPVLHAKAKDAYAEAGLYLIRLSGEANEELY